MAYTTVSTVVRKRSDRADFKPRITSAFGMRVHPYTKEKQRHRGIDFAAPLGTPIVAAGAGTILEAKMFPNYGNKITVDHGAGYTTVFAHLKGFDAQKGQKVKQGEVIGYVGSTGLSKKPHLHYEALGDGKPVDPEEYMKK